MNDYVDTIIKYIVPGGAFILGLIVEYYFFLFKNKISKIRYSINKSLLGSSRTDNYFGQVKILYNDIPVENLYMCYIKLVNTSEKDFENLEIILWSDLDSKILRSSAQKLGDITVLKLTDEYINKCNQPNSINDILLWTRNPYLVPVLNRDDIVAFSCLVMNEKGQEPNVYLNCDHCGLKVEANFIQPQLFWGENKNLSALWGLLVSAILMVPVVYYIQPKVLVSIIVFFFGAFCIVPGAFVVKLIKKARKIIR